MNSTDSVPTTVMDDVAQFAPDSLLLTARQACQLCGASLRTWRSWDSAGKVPRPVRIGRMVYWRRDELLDWVAAGCPRRREWDARNRPEGA